MMWIIIISILVLVTVSSIIIKRLVPESKLDSWANITSIVGGVATAISLLLGAFTFYEGTRVQKELAASTIYQDHMKISIENPQLANSRLVPKPPKKSDSAKIQENYEKYRWYVGHALYSFETILEVFPNDTEWIKTAKGFIISHKEYISSNCFPFDRYSPKIHELIKAAISRDYSIENEYKDCLEN